MLSGSAGLGLARKWSAAAHTQTSRFLFAGGADEQQQQPAVDPLELEMREKIVRHAWNGYRFSGLKGSGGGGYDERTTRFWQDAFEAAFEELESDKSEVSDGAVRDIARLSARTAAFAVDLNTGKPS